MYRRKARCDIWRYWAACRATVRMGNCAPEVSLEAAADSACACQQRRAIARQSLAVKGPCRRNSRLYVDALGLAGTSPRGRSAASNWADKGRASSETLARCVTHPAMIDGAGGTLFLVPRRMVVTRSLRRDVSTPLTTTSLGRSPPTRARSGSSGPCLGASVIHGTIQGDEHVSCIRAVSVSSNSLPDPMTTAPSGKDSPSSTAGSGRRDAYGGARARNVPSKPAPTAARLTLGITRLPGIAR